MKHILIKCSNEIIRDNPDKVQQARNRPELSGWFVGQVMKATNGIFTEKEVKEVLAHRGIVTPEDSDGSLSEGNANVGDRIGRTRRPAHPMDTISGGPIGPSETSSPLSRPHGGSAGDIDGYCSCGRHRDNQCDKCLAMASRPHGGGK